MGILIDLITALITAGEFKGTNIIVKFLFGDLVIVNPVY